MSLDKLFHPLNLQNSALFVTWPYKLERDLYIQLPTFERCLKKFIYMPKYFFYKTGEINLISKQIYKDLKMFVGELPMYKTFKILSK